MRCRCGHLPETNPSPDVGTLIFPYPPLRTPRDVRPVDVVRISGDVVELGMGRGGASAGGAARYMCGKDAELGVASS